MIRDNESEFVKKAKAASSRAAADVVTRARRHGTPIIVWREGRIVELDPYSPEFEVCEADREISLNESKK